jgi:hypothetical protein
MVHQEPAPLVKEIAAAGAIALIIVAAVEAQAAPALMRITHPMVAQA